MDFLKRNLFLILCGVGAGAGVLLAATGMQAMPKVKASLDTTATMYRNLEGVTAVNPRMIEEENRRIASILEDREKVLARAKELHRYTPLVEGAFPNGSAEKRLEFRKKYGEAMRELFDSLHSGGPPGPVDIDRWKETIETEKASDKQFGEAGSASDAPRTPADVLTKAGARGDAVARASMAAAQRISCYAVPFFEDRPPDRFASLEFNAAMKDSGSLEAPDPEDCWRAQLGYWIQKDVVEAINAVNREAAEAARAAETDPWVGVMPVKEVVSVRMFPDYIAPGGELFAPAAPGGSNFANPPGSAASVFTGNASNPTFDVVQFTVKLVMDQRDIPSLVQHMTNNSFHTLLRAAYKAVPPNKNMVGKIYGSEPAVNVVLDLEMVCLGDVFRQWMPNEVCEKYEIKCPERKAAEEEEAAEDEG